MTCNIIGLKKVSALGCREKLVMLKRSKIDCTRLCK